MTEPGAAPLPEHGATTLPAVAVEDYNAEVRIPEGFLGDRASSRAFRAIVDDWRARLRDRGGDPLEDLPDRTPTRKELDRQLAEGDAAAAGLVHGLVEEFAQNLRDVVRGLLALPAWRRVERIVVGGGMRGSRVGEIAIGRTAMLLKAEDVAIDLVPIRHDPDEAGMLGAVQLAPPWIFRGHDALVAVDIGGSNMRAGLVRPHLKKAADLSEACLWDSDIWPHRAEKPKREEAIDRLTDMVAGQVRRAEKRGLRLAPFIGVGCPGRIRPDGGIERGAQNLPGNWESSRFNLPERLRDAVPEIGGDRTVVALHNDAVVQGLSQVPWMRDVSRWGVLTIGTGLGNAVFRNRAE